jgi:hypothetical protein
MILDCTLYYVKAGVCPRCAQVRACGQASFFHATTAPSSRSMARRAHLTGPAEPVPPENRVTLPELGLRGMVILVDHSRDNGFSAYGSQAGHGPWRGCGPAAPPAHRPGCGHPAQAKPAGSVPGEHQHAQPLEQHRPDDQEATGDGARPGGEELPPGRSGPVGAGKWTQPIALGRPPLAHELACYGQGYLLARPGSADEAETMIRQRRQTTRCLRLE